MRALAREALASAGHEVVLPADGVPARLNLEQRIQGATGEALASLGHDVKWWPDLEWRAGAVCAIHVNPDTGVLEGGADPRRLAYALGW